MKTKLLRKIRTKVDKKYTFTPENERVVLNLKRECILYEARKWAMKHALYMTRL
jgi:hypothetical protein